MAIATPSKVSVLFTMAVLVASLCCFADVAQGAVLARAIRATKLQEHPGTGPFLFTKLPEKTLVIVSCREQSSTVGPDNWWLRATVAVPNGKSGYLADWDMQCFGDTVAGHCDPVHHC